MTDKGCGDHCERCRSECCVRGVVGVRQDFYASLRRRADALFELADAVLCTDGPVTSLVGLSLAAEHRRGHGALYDAVNSGVVEVDRLRRAVIGLPLPRDREGRIVLTVEPTCVASTRTS